MQPTSARSHLLLLLILTALTALASCSKPITSPPPPSATADGEPEEEMTDAEPMAEADGTDQASPETGAPQDGKLVLSDAEWRKRLTAEQYRVCREKGTERAFSGKYWKTKTKGVYKCVACGHELFSSQTKFKSGTGWPSFWAPAGDEAVATETDRSHGWIRTEVLCARCGSHLGHVFDDGPKPTNQRYCINSVALELEPGEE